MEVPYNFTQEITCSFNQMSINEFSANQCADEDQHFMPLEIVELIFKSMSTIEDMERASLVCKDWKLASFKFIEEPKILQWPFACEQWEKKFPEYEMLPKLDMSKMVRKLVKFGTSDCPFSKGKLVRQTHLLIYLGTEFRSKTDNKIFPLSLSFFKDLSSGQVLFYNNCLIGNPLLDAVPIKQKFVALYKNPLYIFRDHSINIEPSQEEKEIILTAIKMGYKRPSILELGTALFTINNSSNSEQCLNSIWLTDKGSNCALCEEVLKENDSTSEIVIFSSSWKVGSFNNSTYNFKETFGPVISIFNESPCDGNTYGIMMCKDFHGDVKDEVENMV